MDIRREILERKLRNRKLLRAAKGRAAKVPEPIEETPKTFVGVERFYLVLEPKNSRWWRGTNRTLTSNLMAQLFEKWAESRYKRNLEGFGIMAHIDLDGPRGTLALDLTSRDLALVLISISGDDVKLLRGCEIAVSDYVAPR